MNCILNKNQNIGFNKYDIVNKIIYTIRKAISEQNVNIWMSVFYSEDDIANEAQKSWFHKYFIELNVYEYKIEILNTDIKDCSINLKVRVLIKYRYFDDLDEIHIYKIKYVDLVKRWCVVWAEKVRKPFMKELGEVNSVNFNEDMDTSHSKWWENKILVEAARGSKDFLSSKIYARAITRNIRFREAHPALESVSILSNIMSIRVNNLALETFNENKLKFLSNVYNSFKDTVLVKLIRKDRNNTWSSKFVVPWYGFDEMYMLRDKNGIISCSCSSYMSFLASILRLGGIDSNDVIQIRLDNQDVLIVSINLENYLITSEKISKLTNKTLYHKYLINKAFSDSWFIGDDGRSNLGDHNRENFREKIENKSCIFKFKFKKNISSNNEKPIIPLNISNLTNVSNVYQLNTIIKQHIFELSRRYPESLYTWAKYAYQTLLVSKPESYVIWSLQNNIVKDTFSKMYSTEKFFNYVYNIKTSSIFIESDRIMTSDQVIRHNMGDEKSKSILLFIWFKLKESKNVFMIFTNKEHYCIWKNDYDWVIWSIELWKRVSSTEGKILLAFDDKYSYFPLLNKIENNKNKPIWWNILDKI
ncbi:MULTISPECIES: hypothetical protein [Clostridium]|uniref:hypothetical protein n=1 Tax=Clostridium TaxID=1485 RepID=UPI00082597AD|nr:MULTISPECIES: hypothetical protein [Clostridium]PJI06510.1 hypothetical protein CUB90_00900 [Clostridium sp. CT7]